MITITWCHPRNQNYMTCIALLVTADQATVTINMYRKFSKVRTYGFWDMWADRQTNIQALHCNVSQPYRGGVTSKAAVQFCGWLNVLQVFDATSSEAFQLFTTLAGKVIQSVMSVRPLVRLFVFTVAFKLTDPLPWFFAREWMTIAHREFEVNVVRIGLGTVIDAVMMVCFGGTEFGEQ